MDRMFCYLWYELTDPSQPKFGERFVYAGQDPEKEIWKRIKDSVGVRKDLIKDGTIKLAAYWDVTEYAKMINRCYIHGKVDDQIRPAIGHRKGTTGEIHTLTWEEVKIRVDRFLAKVGQPLPQASLAAWQARTILQVKEARNNGCNTIIAELCARFGKTIWSTALVREVNAPLTIVVSYVLTSFTSFEKDISGYDQFKDIVVVDSGKPDYENAVNAALADSKQVMVFLSMCPGTKRKEKIKFLFNLPFDRLVIVDEADFGVHQPGQSKPLIEAKKDNDCVILMTGTNADKAASHWPVDHMLSVVYPQLLIEKKLGQQIYNIPLKYFKVDPGRHALVVDIQFYQMDLKRAVDFSISVDPDLFKDNGIYLPSWSKTVADPVRAKGFLTRMLESVFLGYNGWDELNADFQTRRSPAKEGQKVAMMFVPASISNNNLGEVVAIAQSALKGFNVIGIYGDTMSNRTAESKVKEEIEKAKNLGQDVLLISAGMAQRSFSVGDISEVYLAYDAGDTGATIQKISRALTPNQPGKVGRIVSLSFDPNRDDKFDSLLIETALNYKKTHGIVSAKEALRDVLKTVDIFRCTPDKAIKIQADEYLETAIERNSITRVIGKVADLNKLSAGELKALVKGNIDVYRAAKQDAALKGRTHSGVNNPSSKGITSDELVTENILAKAREMITTVVENLDIIVYGTGKKNIHEAFAAIQANTESQQAISEEFGIDFELIKELFTRGVINNDLVELKVDI